MVRNDPADGDHVVGNLVVLCLAAILLQPSLDRVEPIALVYKNVCALVVLQQHREAGRASASLDKGAHLLAH